MWWIARSAVHAEIPTTEPSCHIAKLATNGT